MEDTPEDVTYSLSLVPLSNTEFPLKSTTEQRKHHRYFPDSEVWVTVDNSASPESKANRRPDPLTTSTKQSLPSWVVTPIGFMLKKQAKAPEGTLTLNSENGLVQSSVSCNTDEEKVFSHWCWGKSVTGFYLIIQGHFYLRHQTFSRVEPVSSTSLIQKHVLTV